MDDTVAPWEQIGGSEYNVPKDTTEAGNLSKPKKTTRNSWTVSCWTKNT